MTILSRFRLLLIGAFAAAAMANAVGGASAASFEDEQDMRPYIFTQQHNGKPGQFIRLGWPLQVQLPGNPSVWTFQAGESSKIEPRGHALVFSPHRIDGTHSIFVFDFALSADAKAGDEGVITITTDPEILPDSLNKVLPAGKYQIKFKVMHP
ncbi:MAG: hypothetical protein AAF441_05810 [Pseudomonadota bacterium]